MFRHEFGAERCEVRVKYLDIGADSGVDDSCFRRRRRRRCRRRRRRLVHSSGSTSGGGVVSVIVKPEISRVVALASGGAEIEA